MDNNDKKQIIRPLAPSEIMQKKFRILSMARMHLSAHLNLAKFEQALALAIQEQTLLSCVIEEDRASQTYHFVFSGTPTPLNKIYPTVPDLESADAIYREELNTRPDFSQQLFRTVLIPILPSVKPKESGVATVPDIPNEHCEYLFLFIIDHVISDGYSVDAFMVRVFGLYDELMDDNADNSLQFVNTPMVARSIESFYDTALQQTQPNDLAALQQARIDRFQPDSILPFITEKTANVPVGTRPEIRTDFINVDQQHLIALKTACRKQGIKLNHCYSALFILSLLKMTEQEQLNLACKFAIDLRHFLYTQDTDFTDDVPDQATADFENGLLSLRASVYDGHFALNSSLDPITLAKELEAVYDAVHNRPTLLTNVLALSATQRKRGAHLNTMISNVGQHQLKSQWRHCRIHDYYGHGVVLAPVIGIAMLGFDARTAFTIYHVTPWVRTEQVSKVIQYFKEALDAFPSNHQLFNARNTVTESDHRETQTEEVGS